MTTTEQVLEFYADKWTKLVKQSLRTNRRVATGKTVRSVKPNITQNGFTIVGAKHIDNIIKGRGRSKNRSGGGWFKQLQAWAEARGIPKGVVYAIYKSINEKGWKTPPTPDLITSVITASEIKALTRDLAKFQVSLVKDILLKSINK